MDVVHPNTDWCNIAGKASDMHVEASLDVAHPLLIDAITRAQPALCRQRQVWMLYIQICINTITQAQPVLCRLR